MSYLAGLHPSHSHYMRPQQQEKRSSAPTKTSVVAPMRHELLSNKPLPPVPERTAKAAAFVFHACDVTRNEKLARWEFASAVEMMMRQKLVPYLIEQLDAARLDAEFLEAAQGAEECTLDNFSRWFEKFDTYLLHFYPEVQHERRDQQRSGRPGARGERDQRYANTLGRVGRGLRTSMGSMANLRPNLRRSRDLDADGGLPPGPYNFDGRSSPDRSSPPASDAGSAPRRRPTVNFKPIPADELAC